MNVIPMVTLAYEHNGARIGRERFYAIACDPRRSVAVEACAGAGKTWMLVSRMLRALLDGAQPHEILAITFTKKAAGEMRQRLHQWLTQFSGAGPDELLEQLLMRGVAPADAQALCAPLSQLYATVLAAGRPVQVRTFHGWFAALLRAAPLAVLEELGLPPGYDLLEDDSDAVQAVWRPFYEAVAADPQAQDDYRAAVAAHGRSQTQKALAAALARRVEFALADAHGVVDASVQSFGAMFPELDGMAEPTAALAAGTGVHGLFVTAARALGGASAPSFAAKGSALEQALACGDCAAALDALLTRDGDPRKFGAKIVGLEHIRSAQDAAVRLLAACAQHEAWLHQRRMARLTRLLAAEFAALKRARRWVDMNDVERAAQVLLYDPVLSGWVQERLDAQVRHLLIDEFQDTNPLQWQALSAWLAGYAGAGNSAPSVFIVGDPKQSIYRFRRAEPQVFRAAQAFVREGLEGDLLSCDHTHRNAPAVLDAVNTVMAQAQADGDYDGFRHHTTESRAEGRVAALPRIGRDAREMARDAGGGADQGGSADPHAWRDSLTVPRELPEDTLRAIECRQAAQWIAVELACGRAPGDFMVLARKRDRLAAMQDELRTLHIAAQQPEKNTLADAPEVQDVVALLDALVSPAHDLSLARALKSPLFGLDDAALAELALHQRQAHADGRRVTWFDLLLKGGHLTQPLRALGPVLAQWKQWVDTLPPHDALDSIYHQGDVLARYAAAVPAALRSTALAALRALLGAALQIDGGRFLTPYALVRALRAATPGGVKAPVTVGVDAVQLLTIHGAKGLEAPVVLLLDTDAPPPRAETMGVLVDWPGEAEAPQRFTFLASEIRPPACNAEALQAEQAARRREELNALYVAMTRAGAELVLSAVEPHQAAPQSWWQRLQPLAQAAGVPRMAAAATAHANATTAASSNTEQTFDGAVIFLPDLPPRRTHIAQAATKNIAKLSARDPSPDTDATRLGSAMHRLLEWSTGAGITPAQVQAAGREFALTPAQAQAAATVARRILAGEGAWAWDPAAVDWQGNEVALSHEGQVWRLDRLVRERATGHWWVLDYKSAGRPEGRAELLAQMQGYVAAVQAAQPGAVVKAAFLSGDGRLVAVP